MFPAGESFAVWRMAAKFVSSRDSIEVLTLLKNLFPAGDRFGMIGVTTKDIPRQGRTRSNRALPEICSRPETDVHCCALLKN